MIIFNPGYLAPPPHLQQPAFALAVFLASQSAAPRRKASAQAAARAAAVAAAVNDMAKEAKQPALEE